MRNKILIVGANKEEKEKLEQILQEIVELGGELFFADQAEGLAILKKERPQVVFLDAHIASEENLWRLEGICVVLMGHKNELPHNSRHILKPFKDHQVLEICAACLSSEPAAQIPPM